MRFRLSLSFKTWVLRVLFPCVICMHMCGHSSTFFFLKNGGQFFSYFSLKKTRIYSQSGWGHELWRPPSCTNQFNEKKNIKTENHAFLHFSVLYSTQSCTAVLYTPNEIWTVLFLFFILWFLFNFIRYLLHMITFLLSNVFIVSSYEITGIYILFKNKIIVFFNIWA